MSVPPRQKLLADLPSLLLSTSTNNFRSIQISAAPIYGSVCPYLTSARQQSKGWRAPQSGFNLTGELKKKRKNRLETIIIFFVAIQVLAAVRREKGLNKLSPVFPGELGQRSGGFVELDAEDVFVSLCCSSVEIENCLRPSTGGHRGRIIWVRWCDQKITLEEDDSE